MPVSNSQIQISLTQFLNFATKAGPQQLTAVRTIRKQHDEGYDVPPDCYKQFREGVVRMHKDNRPKSFLDQVAARQTEESRAKHYPILARGYKRFMGRKMLSWLEPPRGVWAFEDLRINLRPEIGLMIDGTAHAIKLWMNDGNDLDKRKAAIITHLMGLAIPAFEDELTAAVLDVRRGKLFTNGKSDSEQTTLVRAQARSFISMYREL